MLFRIGFDSGVLVQSEANSVALSSAEAEYMVANQASCEAL